MPVILISKDVCRQDWKILNLMKNKSVVIISLRTGSTGRAKKHWRIDLMLVMQIQHVPRHLLVNEAE